MEGEIILDYPEYGCSHSFPPDWEFGGHLGGDPRADPRWQPSTYEYFDSKLHRIMITQAVLCDHAALTVQRAAIEQRTGGTVCYIFVTRPDGTPEILLSELEP